MVKTSLAEAGDLEVLVGLAVAFRDHLSETSPSEEDLRRGFTRLLADSATDFLVARDGSTPVGYAQVRYRESAWHSGQMAELEDLYIVATARRRGVGRTLLEHALERARERGCRHIALATNERNTVAIALYRSLGFSGEKSHWNGGRQLWLERAL